MTDDDWSDDPLVRALQAPGSPAELAGEREARAAYRAAFPRRSGRRAAGRLGLGGTAVVTTIALTSGVGAAAYTNSLPDPIQDIAHTVLGPVGVPPSPRKVVEPRAADLPQAAVTPTEAATPDTDPTTPVVPADPGEDPTAPDPTGAPDPTPTDGPRPGGSGSAPEPEPDPTTPPTTQPSPDPTPSPEPTPDPTPDPEPTPDPDPVVRPRPGTVTASTSATKVAPGTQVGVSGVLTDKDGATLAGRPVRLVYRTAGGAWTRYAVATSGSDGSVSFVSPPLSENVTARLVVTRKVHSGPVKVKVKPILTLTTPASADRVDVSAAGGQAGDVVVLLRRTRNGVVEAGRTTLAGDGTCSFAIPVPTKQEGYGVRLARTARHLPAAARLRVVAP